jgi:hypothetical protein
VVKLKLTLSQMMVSLLWQADFGRVGAFDRPADGNNLTAHMIRSDLGCRSRGDWLVDGGEVWCCEDEGNRRSWRTPKAPCAQNRFTLRARV